MGGRNSSPDGRDRPACEGAPGGFLLQKREPMPESPQQPWIGVPAADLASALEVLNAMPRIDRRVLRLEVVGDGVLKVLVGHNTGPMNAELTEVELRRDGGSWRAAVTRRTLS